MFGSLRRLCDCRTVRQSWGTWLGYSVVFGTANGFGYGYALQIAAQTNPEKKAFSMGIVTACYVLGAAVFPGILTDAIDRAKIAGALMLLALIIAIAGVFFRSIYARGQSCIHEHRTA